MTLTRISVKLCYFLETLISAPLIKWSAKFRDLLLSTFFHYFGYTSDIKTPDTKERGLFYQGGNPPVTVKL